MPAKQKTLDDLFLHTLKDIYYAEKKILKALPKMAKNASSDALRAAFEKHMDQSKRVSSREHLHDLIRQPRSKQ